MRSRFRSWFRFLLSVWIASGLVATPMLSHAAFSGPSIIYTPSGAKVVPSVFSMLKDSLGSANWGAASTLGDVKIAEAVKPVVGTAGEVGMTVSRTVPWAGVARAASKALPYVAAAGVIYEVYETVRCKNVSPLGVKFSIWCDDGQAQASVQCWQPSPFNTSQCLSSISAALDAAWSGYYAANNCGPAEPFNICTNIRFGPITGTQRTVTYWNYQGNNVNVLVQAIANTAMKCPAVVNFSDPRYSVPGGPPGADGKCPTGAYSQKSSDEAAALITPYASAKNRAPDLLREAVGAGADPTPDAGPATLTGPASANGPATTSSTSTGGSTTGTTTTAPRYDITYQGDSYTYNTTTVNITNNNGTTTTTTTTAPPANEIKTCGLPGTPACKMDESGTPSYTRDEAAHARLGTLQTEDAQKRDAAAASVQTPEFGWFGAPPVAECTPFDLPNSMGSINPCGGVSMVREVMAYIWALTGAWACLGMIRKTFTGG